MITINEPDGRDTLRLNGATAVEVAHYRVVEVAGDEEGWLTEPTRDYLSACADYLVHACHGFDESIGDYVYDESGHRRQLVAIDTAGTSHRIGLMVESVGYDGGALYDAYMKRGGKLHVEVQS